MLVLVDSNPSTPYAPLKLTSGTSSKFIRKIKYRKANYKLLSAVNMFWPVVSIGESARKPDFFAFVPDNQYIV